MSASVISRRTRGPLRTEVPAVRASSGTSGHSRISHACVFYTWAGDRRTARLDTRPH